MPRVCRVYQHSGECPWGNQCRHLHVTTTPGPCRHGAGCRRRETCVFDHPPGPPPPPPSARPRVRPAARPRPRGACRYGVQCRRRETCAFSHDAAGSSGNNNDSGTDEPAQSSAAPPDCVICLEHAADGHVQCASAAAHAMCRACFSGFVTERCDREAHLERLRASEGLLACPVPGCASEPFGDMDVARSASPEAATRYFTTRLGLARSAGRQEAMSELGSPGGGGGDGDGGGADSKALVAAQLREQFPNAIMCGRCSFGPVISKGCNDLRAHNGERVGATGVVSNACPRCGWFAPRLRSWPRWDGRLPEGV